MQLTGPSEFPIGIYFRYCLEVPILLQALIFPLTGTGTVTEISTQEQNGNRITVMELKYHWLQVTDVIFVPPVMIHIAKSPLVFQYDLSSIRGVTCGAAPLSRETEQQFKQVVGDVDIRQGIIICQLCALKV